MRLLLLFTTVLVGCCPAQQWSQVQGAPRYSRGGFAYDPVRGRTVHVEHSAGMAFLGPGGTFSWDGAKWQYLGTAFGSGWSSSQLAWDAAHGYVLAWDEGVPLSGPTVPATWRFDGRTWSPVGPAPTASPFALVHDPTSSSVLMVGLGPVSTPYATWRWTGLAWAQLPVSTPQLWQPAISADLVRQRVVAFGTTTAVSVGETWEWDGASWTQIQPAHQPPALVFAAMAFDEVRGRTVLFGGTTYGATPADHAETWEWDGLDWTQVATPSQPPPRRSHHMVFDRGSGRVQAWFGVDSAARSFREGWEYDGSSWTQLPAMPGQWFGTAAADDLARGRTVLFDYLGVTREWDGRTFAQRVTPTAPAPRWATLAFDPLHAVTLLFGGSLASSPYSYLDDTWTWNGAVWTQTAPPGPRPAPRGGHASCFAAASNGVLLFGGSDQSQVFGDTWLWNGAQWSDLTPSLAGAPSARFGAVLASEPASGGLLLAGGQVSGGASTADTWRWNGSWALAAASRGSTLSAVRVAAEPQGGGMLMTAQDYTTAESWRWDGQAWHRLPVDLGADVLCLDPVRQRLTAFWLYQQWTWTPTAAATAAVGAGCGAPAPALVAAGSVRTGEPLVLRLLGVDASAPALLALGLAPANVSIGNGCRLLVQGPWSTRLALANACGIASFPAPVPADLSLRGLQVHAQAAGLQAGAPFGGIALGNGLALTVGD